MKQLITKSDGTPTKSKVHAIKFLQEKGIDESCLIQENGQFFYEDSEGVNEEDLPMATPIPKDELPPVEDIFEHTKPLMKSVKTVSWDTPVFVKGDERTRLVVPGTDIEAIIIAKHPAGQLRNKSAFEISIGDENFVMSVDLISKLFKVKEVK